MREKRFFYIALVMASAIVISCSSGIKNEVTAEDKASDTKTEEKTEEKAAEPSAADKAAGDVETTGTINITAKLEGTPPKAKPINMNADPVCAQAHSSPVMSQEVVVNDQGQLANVIVWLDGVKGDWPKPSEPVVLDQKGCMYEPRVMGLYDGQELLIKNSDKTLHNVHCYKGSSTCFNQAMFQGMQPLKKTFDPEEPIVKLKFKCDVHPWMTAYALLATNPFFGTTNTNGKGVIENIPAGEYTVKWWHEKYGSGEKTVNVNAGSAAEETIVFKAGS